jgi:hypothetical protein
VRGAGRVRGGPLARRTAFSSLSRALPCPVLPADNTVPRTAFGRAFSASTTAFSSSSISSCSARCCSMPDAAIAACARSSSKLSGLQPRLRLHYGRLACSHALLQVLLSAPADGVCQRNALQHRYVPAREIIARARARLRKKNAVRSDDTARTSSGGPGWGPSASVASHAGIGLMDANAGRLHLRGLG